MHEGDIKLTKFNKQLNKSKLLQYPNSIVSAIMFHLLMPVKFCENMLKLSAMIGQWSDHYFRAPCEIWFRASLEYEWKRRREISQFLLLFFNSYSTKVMSQKLKIRITRSFCVEMRNFSLLVRCVTTDDIVWQMRFIFT